ARVYYLAGARQARKRFMIDQAERLYRSYLQLVEAPSSESIKARNEFGEKVLQLQGKFDLARDEHLTALDHAQKAGDKSGEGASLRALGALYRETGEVAKAHEMHTRALAIHRQLGDRRSEGLELSNFAYLYGVQGQLAKSREFFDQALIIHREVMDQQNESRDLTNLAVVLHEHGSLDEAEAICRQVLALVRTRGDRRLEAVNLGGLALIFHGRGLLVKAQQFYEQALAIHRDIGDRPFEGYECGNLGTLTFALGYPFRARRYLEQALSIAREVGDLRFQGAWLVNLAYVELYLTADFSKAEQLLEQGDHILEKIGDRIQRCALICLRGHICIAREKSSLPYLEQARTLAEKADVLPQSQAGRALAKLTRAEETFKSGQFAKLFRGECIQDIPVGLRRWLVSRYQISRQVAQLPDP
ncbi:tetratricopeptide repeat protein, partial [candidate division CSSED10-310 bacterium]